MIKLRKFTCRKLFGHLVMFNYIRTLLILLCLIYVFLDAVFHVCLVTMHREQLNTLCSDITSALLSAVDCCETSRTVPNFAWFDELLQFRKDSPEAHRIWVSAGRPRVRGKCMTVGLLQELVKRAIRAVHIMYERKVNDRLFNCLIKRNSQKFWKD